MYRKVCLPLTLAVFGLSDALAFDGSDEDALMRAFGDETFISIATGAQQPISQAPAVASVITASDIREMGARDLDEVLQSIPGLHVSVAPRGYLPLYVMRGIYSENNPQVLMLVNDIPITNLYVGNRGELWGGMPVNDIARIEIIRGPGSAIYGADAFAGTINIITKAAADIEGTQFGARAGSYNTREGWILHGGAWRDVSIALSLQAMKTDGQDQIIDSDAQSFFDFVAGTAVSNAPGPVNLDRNNIDARIDMEYDKWRMRLGYQGRSGGIGAGLALALDPLGEGESERYNADLTYQTALSQHWDFTGTLSYYDTTAETDLVLFPPGHVSGGPFPDGVIAQPYVYERHTRLNLSAFFHGFENHSIRIGAGAIHGDMYKIRERKNYFLAPNGMPVPLGGLIDVSNDPGNVFIQPNDRRVFYAFIQDQWNISQNWTLTSGVRHDDYSDFGSTTNPRAALVWRTTPDLTTKLLYGRAFRAPAFNELYNINNPIAEGNPELKPETIDTYEIAFNYQYSQRLHAGLNIFRYRMSDVIRFSTDTFRAENVGEITSNGMEVEATYSPLRQLRLTANFAVQNSTDNETNSRVANSPQHQAYLRAIWEFLPSWSLNAQFNWVADRQREPGDAREAIDDYLGSDLTIRYRSPASPWEFAISGRNILDEDMREPSPRLFPVAGSPAMIPNDLPLAGRHFFVEARYHLDGLMR